MIGWLRTYWRPLSGCIAAAFLGAFFFSLIFVAYVSSFLSEEDASFSRLDSTCNVMRITLHGCLLTYPPGDALPVDATSQEGCETVTTSESIAYQLVEARDNPQIKAVLLEVDSSGGYPVAGEEVADAVEDASVPVVGWIRTTGVSAAYWAVSAADTIVASANSDVGGIGVTMSYLEQARKNAAEGLVYQDLSAGRLKNMLDPDKPLTQEERAIAQRDVNIIHENFIKVVARNRNLSVTTVRGLADGSTLLGEAANAAGLIDQVGTLNQVKAVLEETIGEAPIICEQ